MATRIVNEALFHINKVVAYSQYKPMAVGEVIDIGGQSNPFFGFYETTTSWVGKPVEGFNLVRELVWETIRLSEFRDEPSRQRCIWVVRTEAEVKAWQPAGHPIVKLRASGTLFKADVEHLPMPHEPVPPLSVWHERARRYWGGELTQNPQPEFLFIGTIRVEELIQPSGA